jgi:hypothetical protein
MTLKPAVKRASMVIKHEGQKGDKNRFSVIAENMCN